MLYYVQITAIGILVLGAACGFIYLAVTVIRFFRDRGQLPIEDRFVVMIVVDGANLMQARDLLLAGMDDPSQYASAMSQNFPNISHYFLENGAFAANGISVWPSSSIPAHTGIMTGSYPRRTGVMGQRQFAAHQRRHTSYIGLGILKLKTELSRHVKTLCEYFPRVRSLVLLQVANRGSSLFVPSMPHDSEVIKRACQIINLTDFLGRYSKTCQIPRLVVMTLPDIDHETHNVSIDTQKSTELYLKADEHIGTIIDLYKEKGIYDKTLFVLCSDHGMAAVENHLTLDNLMHDLRFDVFQSLKWCVVPAWGSFESNFYVGWRRKFDRAYNSVSLWGGNSDALVYVKGQKRDDDGSVVEEGWDIDVTEEMLTAYEIGGTRINIVDKMLGYSPGIGLVFTSPEQHIFNVHSAAGQGQIEERERDGAIEFRYSIVSGDDPLGYADNHTMASHIETNAWLSDQQWLELSYLEHYPDALRRIAHSFGNANSAAMHIVGGDGWDFAPHYVAKQVLVGSNGSLNEEASLVPIMFHGPGIRSIEMPYARTVDIVPTILKYFDTEAPDVDGRALPVFEDAERNHGITNAGAEPFWMTQCEDESHVYRVEHLYASYDRRIVRVDKTTGERKTLVASVRDALPELQRQANISVELAGIRNGTLVLQKVYADEDREGREILFDVGSGEFE